jgi:hydroxyacylglutathione hydrolase
MNTLSLDTLSLVTVPAFDDNYLWLLHDGTHAIVVDPGDAAPIQAKLAELGLQLEAILVTHHHADHVGGVDALRDATGAHVYGPAFEKIPEPVQRVGAGETVSVLGIEFEVLEVPGHTLGHIAYFHEGSALHPAPLLFCGDTLFSGGCGRLFEGTPAQMLASLGSLASLPDDTIVCCAHEYTLSNLKFALVVDGANADLVAYEAHCQALRKDGIPTIPSQIGLEKKINPFLRSHTDGVTASVQKHTPTAQSATDIFAALREWKNNFR